MSTEHRAPGEPRPASAVALLAAAALAGTGLLAWTLAPHGIGLGTTAAHLFTAAEGMRAGEGLMHSRGEPFTMWPPLMATLLAAGGELGLGYPTVAFALALLAQAGLLFFGALLLWRTTRSVLAALAFTAVLALAPEVFADALVVHTDPLFIALVMASLWALVRYFERPTLARLCALEALAATACLQRYPGMALVAATGLAVCLHPAAVAPRRRILRAVVGAGLAVAPLLARMAYNRHNLGSWGSLGVPAERPAAQNALDAVSVTARFFAPDGIRTSLGIASLAALAVLVALCLLRLRRERDEETRSGTLACVVFAPFYFAMVLAATSRVSLDPVSERYMLPVLPILWAAAILGFVELRRRLAGASAGKRRRALALPLLVFGFLLGRYAYETLGQARRVHAWGIGTQSLPRYKASELRAWLEANPLAGEVLSNVPEFYILTTDRRARYVPEEAPREALERAPVPAWLVWVRYARNATPAPSAAGDGRKLEPVATLRDGDVYRLIAEE